jgi:hypothetical protein
MTTLAAHHHSIGNSFVGKTGYHQLNELTGAAKPLCKDGEGSDIPNSFTKAMCKTNKECMFVRTGSPQTQSGAKYKHNPT